MKKPFHWLLLLFLSASGLIGMPAACLAGDGFEIHQSSMMSGLHTVFVCDSGVKIVEPRTNITYLCSKPLWRWEVFNEHTHKYYQCAPEAFVGTACERMVIYLHEKLSRRLFRKVDSPKVLNVTVQKFWSPLGASTIEPVSPEIGHKQRFFAVSFLVNDSLPEAVRLAIGRIYGLPLAGIPMDANYMDEFDHARKALLTVKIDKKQLSPELFKGPKNCTKVMLERDVFVDAERDSDVNQLLEPR